MPDYVDALAREMALRAEGETLRTVYLGGGTPSTLPGASLRALGQAIGANWELAPDVEFSLEANPGDIDAAHLKTLLGLGANRLSLGVQSFADAELEMLGRRHTASEAVAAFRAARAAGFRNLSLDLIYGLPHQTQDIFKRSLEQAVALAPEHISLYALSLEPGAELARRVACGELPEPDADRAADAYLLACELLQAHGYRHYEISNWTLPGHECRHNLTYWRNRPYYGLGAAAHSAAVGRRYANTEDLDAYVRALKNGEPPPLALDETIGPELALAETVILGLRLADGVRPDDIRARFGIDLMQHHGAATAEVARLGLLQRHPTAWRLTTRGWLLSNEVFWRLLPGGNHER